MTETPKQSSLTPDPIAGLEGVVVANTQLSEVDGKNGKLVLRGKSIEDLAGKVSFEGAVRHLWLGSFSGEVECLTAAFGSARMRAAEVHSRSPVSPGLLFDH